MINNVVILMIMSSSLFFNFLIHVRIKKSDFFLAAITLFESVYALKHE
jgi:hypothetical protein